MYLCIIMNCICYHFCFDLSGEKGVNQFQLETTSPPTHYFYLFKQNLICLTLKIFNITRDPTSPCPGNGPLSGLRSVAKSASFNLCSASYSAPPCPAFTTDDEPFSLFRKMLYCSSGLLLLSSNRPEKFQNDLIRKYLATRTMSRYL